MEREPFIGYPFGGNGHKVMTLLFVIGQEMSKWEYSTSSEALNPSLYPLSCFTSALFRCFMLIIVLHWSDAELAVRQKNYIANNTLKPLMEPAEERSCVSSQCFWVHN